MAALRWHRSSLLAPAPWILGLAACGERPAPAPGAGAGSGPPAVSPSAPAPSWAVGLRSTGPVRYGMTLAQMRQATGDSLAGAPSGPECGYVTLAEAPAGLRWMVEDGQVVRVDAESAALRPDRGTGIGMTEAEVHRLYGGELEVQPHKYVEGGHYLVYLSPQRADSGLRIVFETDGSAITRFRAGVLPAVAYVEGCA